MAFIYCHTTISTHTLTWSVTVSLSGSEYRQSISTHTLTWSVTDYSLASFSRILISTHTLTWSVTGIFWQQRSNWKFQLTRSRGAWPSFLLTCLFSVTLFQLTRSRGAWHAKVGNHLACYHFNSHAHVERDFQCSTVFYKVQNFNSHAHVERDSVK